MHFYAVLFFVCSLFLKRFQLYKQFLGINCLTLLPTIYVNGYFPNLHIVSL
jgi:hypothetical protein